MTEPVTIKLQATGPLTGEGLISLSRNDFVSTGRTSSATIPSGSRVDASFFGFFNQGEVKSVSVTATTTDPRDVLRVYLGSSIRTELRLDGPQTVTLGPAEQLGFVTETNLEIVLVVNVIPEEVLQPGRTPPRPVRARLTRPSGFSATGRMNTSLSWDHDGRLLVGSGAEGSLALATVDPRESRFDGYMWRCRVSGTDGPAQVGVGSGITGDFVSQEIQPGQWSAPRRVSHDDLLSVESPGKRADAPTVVVDHELLPTTTGFSQLLLSEPGPEPEPGTPPPAGILPLDGWVNVSVNAAGAIVTSVGLELWTHAISGNAPGGFVGTGIGNKAICGSDFLDGLSLSALTSLSIRFANRTPGNSSLLNTPYINLVIDLHGDGTQFKIGVLDVALNPSLSLLTDVSVAGPTDHEILRSWVGGGKIKIVNELAGVSPVISLGVGWLNKVFVISDIIAEYPNAKLASAFPGDNGLPADLSLPSILLVLGDSNYALYSRVLVRSVSVNQ